MTSPLDSLGKFFRPRSVAVIGASRDSTKVGGSLLSNLIGGGFPGAIYPINPNAKELFGLTAYPNISAVPGEVGLALIAVPAPLVCGSIEECAAKGIGAAVVITAGFKETGRQGAELEEELLKRAMALGVRLIGPNCLGIIDTASRLNASFGRSMPLTGKISFFSQSGALCAAILDWAIGSRVGFSKFVSLGNKADVSEIELMDFLARDEETAVVLGYIEGVKEGRAFLRAAHELTRLKPLLLLKSGGTAAGARAASSHTGTLSGSETAFVAATKQAGIIRAHDLEELFDYAVALAFQPLPAGPRLAILTNAGGPGIMAADACERLSVPLAVLKEETVTGLKQFLPPAASANNPIDILGDAPAERYRLALQGIAGDPGADGLLVILTPQAMTQVEESARAVGDHSAVSAKPVLAAFMGKSSIEEGERILREFGVANYPEPERAVKVFRAMVKYREIMGRADEEPALIGPAPDRAGVAAVLKRAGASGRSDLDQSDASAVITAYGFRTPLTLLAQTSREARAAADGIGYPVVLKVGSPDIQHKTDVGGVKVGLRSGDEVELAFQEITASTKRYLPTAYIRGVHVQQMIGGRKEVIIGMNRDPDFGPLIMVGLGGIYVEVLKDVSFRIAPFTLREANELIRELRSYPLLAGFRGAPPCDTDALVEAILRVCCMAVDFDQIIEMEINPLAVGPKGEGCIAIDARMAIKPGSASGSEPEGKGR